jgi:hypothetical protein
MFKKGIFAVTALIFLFSSVSITFALDKGNKRKGKYTYRKVYKACMERGEVDSPKPPISPDTKTQAQWTRTFEKRISQISAASRSGRPCRKKTSPIFTPICMIMRPILRPLQNANNSVQSKTKD